MTAAPKTKPVINNTAARKAILEVAKATRHHPFTRVSSETLFDLEEFVRQKIRAIVQAAPSKGKTI